MVVEKELINDDAERMLSWLEYASAEDEESWKLSQVVGQAATLMKNRIIAQGFNGNPLALTRWLVWLMMVAQHPERIKEIPTE